MSNEPKLLTEAAWRRLFASNTLDEAIAYMGERGLIAPEPLLGEAIELVVGDDVTRSSAQIAAIREGRAGKEKVNLALAALQRGMEIEREKRPVLTREGLEAKIYNAFHKSGIVELDRYDFGPHGHVSYAIKFADNLHAALQEQLK